MEILNWIFWFWSFLENMIIIEKKETLFFFNTSQIWQFFSKTTKNKAFLTRSSVHQKKVSWLASKCRKESKGMSRLLSAQKKKWNLHSENFSFFTRVQTRATGRSQKSRKVLVVFFKHNKWSYMLLLQSICYDTFFDVEQKYTSRF